MKLISQHPLYENVKTLRGRISIHKYGNDLLKGLKILKSIKLLSDVSKCKKRKKRGNENEYENGVGWKVKDKQKLLNRAKFKWTDAKMFSG